MIERDASGRQGSPLRLRILATTDVHASLLGWDYSADRPRPGTGLEALAALIAATRQEGIPSVLLDNGDFLQGSALAEAAQMGHCAGRHPAIEAFEALGHDAVGLGNHEFDYGLKRLTAALAEARLPFVAANVVHDDSDARPLVQPWVMIRRELADAAGRAHQIRIGVIGLTPPETMIWNRRHLEGRLRFLPMRETLAATIPEIRRQGADIVVALAHAGLACAERSGTPTRGRGEIGAGDLLDVPGLDALIAGHSHEVFPPEGRRITTHGGAGVAAVQPGHGASHLGRIDLDLAAPEGALDWRVISASAHVMPVEAAASLPEPLRQEAARSLRQRIAADHEATRRWLASPLGESPQPLTTWFATLGETPALRLIARAKEDHVGRMLQGSPSGDLPVIALAQPFRSGGRGGPEDYSDIPAGPLRLRHLLDLYPFANSLVAIRSTGRVLIDLLERSSRLFRPLRPDLADQELVDPDRPAFDFLTAPSLSYRIAVGRPPLMRDPGTGAALADTGRIRDPRLPDGRALTAEMPIILVTNSHAAGRLLPEAENLLTAAPVSCVDVVSGWLTCHRRLPERRDGGGWRLELPEGSSAIWRTGPGAAAHLQEISWLCPENLGPDESGWLRFRLKG